MKNMFYAGVFVLFVVFGLTAYRQSEKANVFREEKNKMHQALIKMRNQVQASQVEISKLKQIIEAERKNTEKLVQQAMQKK
ncbi:MAG: hypothetical protein JJE09_13255 [Bacteroidia bacterium]|nr:hypothetical protein [Bacteroidia bacterium]